MYLWYSINLLSCLPNTTLQSDLATDSKFTIFLILARRVCHHVQQQNRNT